MSGHARGAADRRAGHHDFADQILSSIVRRRRLIMIVNATGAPKPDPQADEVAQNRPHGCGKTMTSDQRSRAAASPPAAEGGLSIVVPVYNEAAGLPACMRASPRSPPRSAPRAGSPARSSMSTTAAATLRSPVALALPADGIDVQVVSLSRNFGKEAALMAGLDHARLGAVLFMDGDGQHPPALIETLVGHWLDDGYDVVYTAKAHRDERVGRCMRLAVKGFYSLINWGRAAKNPGRCRRFPPAVAARRGGAAADAGAQPLLQGTVRAGSAFASSASTTSRPSAPTARTSWNLRSLIGLSVEGLTSFSVAPLRLASLLGMVLAVGALRVRRVDPDRDLRLRAHRAGLSLAHRRHHGDRRRATADDRGDGRVHRQDARPSSRAGRSISSPSTALKRAEADDRPGAAEAARNAAE